MREIGRMRNGGFAYGKTEKKYCVNGKSAGVSIADLFRQSIHLQPEIRLFVQKLYSMEIKNLMKRG